MTKIWSWSRVFQSWTINLKRIPSQTIKNMITLFLYYVEAFLPLYVLYLPYFSILTYLSVFDIFHFCPPCLNFQHQCSSLCIILPYLSPSASNHSVTQTVLSQQEILYSQFCSVHLLLWVLCWCVKLSVDIKWMFRTKEAQR